MAIEVSEARRGPPPDYTEATGGGAKLAKAIGKVAQAEAARSLGVSPAFLNHMIHGRKAPGRELAIKIRDLYGVAVDVW